MAAERRDFFRAAVFFLIIPRLAALSIALYTDESAELTSSFFPSLVKARIFFTDFVIARCLRRLNTRFLAALLKAFLAPFVMGMCSILAYFKYLCKNFKLVRKTHQTVFIISTLRYYDAMIAQLRGTILDQDLNSVVLNAGGVGYLVFISPDTSQKLTEMVSHDVVLFTHLSVRENALDLYGFLDREELSFFEMLISISGIGPKSGLAILSIVDVATLKEAIRSGDSSYLTKVSGIGKKIAQKIVLELNDKIEALAGESLLVLKEDIDTLEALKSLGYSTIEARETLKQIPSKITGTQKRIKEALKLLGK